MTNVLSYNAEASLLLKKAIEQIKKVGFRR